MSGDEIINDSAALATTAPVVDTPDTLLTGDKSVIDGAKPPVTDKAEGDTTVANGDKEAGERDQSSPDTYADFVMPEGVSLNAELLSEVTPLFKELNLTQEQAQKLVDFEAKRVQAGSQKQADAFTQQINAWQTESKNDSEFGGDKFNENLSHARAAVGKFGTPALKQLLDDYGIGNNPEVIRFMVRVGKLTAEDSPSNRTAPVSKPSDWASQMYPTEKPA